MIFKSIYIFLFWKDIVSPFHLHYFTTNSLIAQRQTLLTRGVFYTAEDRFDLDPEVLGTFLEGVTDDVDDFTWSDVPFCVSVRRFAAIWHLVGEQLGGVASLRVEHVVFFTVLAKLVGYLVDGISVTSVESQRLNEWLIN